MKTQWALSLLAASSAVAARRAGPRDHSLLRHLHGDRAANVLDNQQSRHSKANVKVEREQTFNDNHRFLNSKTQEFSVNGTGMPNIDFDIGESYAGLLPISNKTDDDNKLFFWYFPTQTEDFKDKKEIVIWLQGGPGCSSMVGLAEEHGPWLWQEGTEQPIQNPWAWNLLTNVVYVDQPVGVGYGTGTPSISNEDQLAVQFLGFWKNFMDTFDMHGWKVYVTGESYGGAYCPYVSEHMVHANDTTYYDLGGMLVYDGVYFDGILQGALTTGAFVKEHPDQFPFTDAYKAELANHTKVCGFDDYLDKYLVYPPAGPLAPNPPDQQLDGTSCYAIWDDVYEKAIEANPCFNVYNILDRCPTRFNPIEDTSNSYFQRTDVKKALHAPADSNWQACTDEEVFVGNGDSSIGSGNVAIPTVIDHTNNVILAQGSMDFLLQTEGMLIGIQNMTWNGKLGFQSKPQDPFYVPRYGLSVEDPTTSSYGAEAPAGAGVMGTTHTERGFSIALTHLAGHEGPMYAPAGAMRHLEKLLGRVQSMSGTEPFTLPQLQGVKQDSEPLGPGIVKIP